MNRGRFRRYAIVAGLVLVTPAIAFWAVLCWLTAGMSGLDWRDER